MAVLTLPPETSHILPAAAPPPLLKIGDVVGVVDHEAERIAADAAPRRWFILLVVPGQEAHAAAGFVGRGWRIFLPTFVKRIGHRGIRRDITHALFPGYLFIQLPVGDERWNRVRGVAGVRDFLRLGHDAPVVVPDAMIDAIREKEQQLRLPPSKRLRQYRRGEHVRITAGPYVELMGPIEELRVRERCIVLVNLLGRTVPVEVSEGMLSRAGLGTDGR